MNISKFPSNGNGKSTGRHDEHSAAADGTPLQKVVSLKSYRRAVSRKASAEARRELRGKVKAPSLRYVLLLLFFAGSSALAFGLDKVTGLSDAGLSALVIGSVFLLAWILHLIFLNTFLLLVPGILVTFGSTMFFGVLGELSFVLVGVIAANVFLQLIGWLE